MMPNIDDLLSEAGAEEDPLDIVMGDHWAELHLKRIQKISVAKLLVREQSALAKRSKLFAAGRSDGSSASRAASAKLPQAMVKLIGSGGTANAKGLAGQMDYLTKGGTAELERSELYFGTPLDEEGRESLIEQWGLPQKKTQGATDRTSHFVVSFPIGTNHEAAYRAGRAWATTMFAEGRYGDTFDHYTAFHTDREHPHMHVVVNRRGLDNDTWLKVSKRSPIDYDELRIVQVEVSAKEGIGLQAVPRRARGIHERPIPDGEIRRAKAENRKPVAPAHTPITAARNAASVQNYRRNRLMTSAGNVTDPMKMREAELQSRVGSESDALKRREAFIATQAERLDKGVALRADEKAALVEIWQKTVDDHDLRSNGSRSALRFVPEEHRAGLLKAYTEARSASPVRSRSELASRAAETVDRADNAGQEQKRRDDATRLRKLRTAKRLTEEARERGSTKPAGDRNKDRDDDKNQDKGSKTPTKPTRGRRSDRGGGLDL